MNEGPLKVLLLAAEVVPFAKTGGLADVAGALPKALQSWVRKCGWSCRATGLSIRSEHPLPVPDEYSDIPGSRGEFEC